MQIPEDYHDRKQVRSTGYGIVERSNTTEGQTVIAKATERRIVGARLSHPGRPPRQIREGGNPSIGVININICICRRDVVAPT